MALFSDIDWVILLGVAAFLLFGSNSAGTMRAIGHWYGRALRAKNELMSELTKAADLPAPTPGKPLSLRATLMSFGETPTGSVVPGPPPNVPTPPAPYRPALPTDIPWSGGLPAPTWSVALPSVWTETEGPR
ncbi:MAG: hypothetical protein ACREB9_06470 [Thermoplasmata archaeon]